MSSADAGQIGLFGRRLSRLSPAAMLCRTRDKVHAAIRPVRAVEAGGRPFTSILPPRAAEIISGSARSDLLAAAEMALSSDPDAHDVSRMQTLTLLAMAYFLNHDEAYASRVAAQLDTWWRENPSLSSTGRPSGVEVGIRLISMVWVRRLLDDWPNIADLFEHNHGALTQIRWHQRYLAAVASSRPPANRGRIAEAACQHAVSCAFPWFAESARWRRTSAKMLERELLRRSYPSGVSRGLSSSHQRLAAELALLATAEAELAGEPLGPAARRRLCAMVDSCAALLDETLRPPGHDDGSVVPGLLLDLPTGNPWSSLLAKGAAVFGGLEWWPIWPADAANSIIASMAETPREVPGRPALRPWRFAEAGQTLLRTAGRGDPEIWCRCSCPGCGRHADSAGAALSIEVRRGGVDILAESSTWSHLSESAWRAYFRSGVAHNSLELGSRQPAERLRAWPRRRTARSREVEVLDIGDAVEWTAQDQGCASRLAAVQHRRCVRLDRASRIIDIVDEIDGSGHELQLAFHLGPEVYVELDAACATLRWPGAATPGAARLELPPLLRWSLHRGETDPIRGWYSARPGHRTPSFTLIGRGCSASGVPMSTRLTFIEADDWRVPALLSVL